MSVDAGSVVADLRAPSLRLGGVQRARAAAAALGAGALGGVALAVAVSPARQQAPTAARAVVVVAFALAGMAASWRRPGERQGVLVLWAALLGALATLAAAGVASTGSSQGLAHLARPFALALLPVAVMQLLLGLPDGSCSWSRRAVAAGYGAAALIGLLEWTRRPGMPWWPIVAESAVAVSIGLVGSQRRYARAKGLELRRMQWFGWAMAVGLEVGFVSGALRLLWGWPTRAGLVAALACLPFALAVALGSSQRFAGRIDRLLAHTVSLAGLTAVVVAVYVTIVVGLGRTPTDSERSLLALSMAAAAVAALLYGPARTRLTQYANRIVYGEREAPDEVVRTFGSRLSRAIPMDELLLQVAESLRKTLGLRAAEVWTGANGRLERAVSVPDRPAERLQMTGEEEAVVARSGVTGAAWVQVWLPALLDGRPDAVLRVAPATHSGHVLGLIVAERGPDSDAFTDDDDSMLTELARQVGLALHNVELDSALQESLDEVRRQAVALQESRARIVAASDAARRNIERNLHDGAQQHLVALAVNVRLARRMIDTDAEAAAGILDQLGEGLQDAVQELRALAHGIYPPLLVDRGLEEALRSAAGRAALPTEVVAEGLRRYSPEEEAAVYFCCMEALQNAGKHAGDSATAVVRVWDEPDALHFEVADTGGGFDAAGAKSRGAGFMNMSDRVGAIGGRIEIESTIGSGTIVRGTIPISG